MCALALFTWKERCRHDSAVLSLPFLVHVRVFGDLNADLVGWFRSDFSMLGKSFSFARQAAPKPVST